MAYRNQNYMTNRKIKELVDKNQKGYVPEEEFTPVLYYFKSYNNEQGEELWGTGTVETTGVEENGYTEVEILTNDTESSFVGQKVFIASNASADGTTLYPLYSDAGETALGIYVKISKNEFEDEEFTPTLYHFKSYNNEQGDELWGTGTVQTTGVEDNGYTQVKVLTNDTNASFVNQLVYIASTSQPDGTTLYPLYSDAGETALGIYVKISENEIEESQDTAQQE